MLEIPTGYCHCGCGVRTKIATRTNSLYGHRKGEPQRFLRGHRTPTTKPLQTTVEDRGHETPCHIWQGHRMPNGYGQVRRGGKLWLTHRYAYVQARGSLPAGREVHHKCRVRECVNLAHLTLDTPEDHRAMHGQGSLTDEQVREIRGSTEPQRVLAQRYDIGQTQVWRVRNGVSRISA